MHIFLDIHSTTTNTHLLTQTLFLLYLFSKKTSFFCFFVLTFIIKLVFPFTFLGSGRVIMRLSFAAFFILVAALVTRPTFSWTCSDRYSMSGMDLASGKFSNTCLLSNNPGCNVHDGSLGVMEIELDTSPCVDVGDVLMMCTSIYASSFDKDSEVTLGAAEDERDCNNVLKNGAYSEICTQTFACGDEGLSRSAFVKVNKVKGQVSVVGDGTTISKPRFLPLPNKGAKKTKLGALYPNEKLFGDGMYNFTFIPREHKEDIGLSQIMGRVTSLNASFSRSNNAYFIFRGAHIDFNHCDQLKYYDTNSEQRPIIRMRGRHALIQTPTPLEVHISADGINWEKLYDYLNFEAPGAVSLSDPSKCHIRFTVTKDIPQENESSSVTDPDVDNNYWLLREYALQIPTTEIPNSEESGAQVMYYQTYHRKRFLIENQDLSTVIFST